MNFFLILLNIEYNIEVYFAVSLEVFSLATNVEGKKIPGLIKKLNKFLGLPPKSEKVMDILSISGNTAKINDNAGSINANAGSINDNAGNINDNAGNINVNSESINNITGTISENTGNIAKNTADIARYHPPRSKLKKTTFTRHCSVVNDRHKRLIFF